MAGESLSGDKAIPLGRGKARLDGGREKNYNKWEENLQGNRLPLEMEPGKRIFSTIYWEKERRRRLMEYGERLAAFRRGELSEGWRFFGAHREGEGWRFRVWAPMAQRVSVVGEFNGWDV